MPSCYYYSSKLGDLDDLRIIFLTADSIKTQVTTQYGSDPVVVEQIGGISSCSFNFSASIEEDQDGEAFVFDVEGPEGRGQLIIIAPNNDINNPESVILRKEGVDHPLSDFVIGADSPLE